MFDTEGVAPSAQERTRTSMPLQAQRPERCASTIPPPGQAVLLSEQFSNLIILSELGTLDNALIFCDDEISIMKNVVVLFSFFVITPVAFLIFLVLGLFLYHNHIT